jgi:hypothetical protein
MVYTQRGSKLFPQRITMENYRYLFPVFIALYLHSVAPARAADTIKKCVTTEAQIYRSTLNLGGGQTADPTLRLAEYSRQIADGLKSLATLSKEQISTVRNQIMLSVKTEGFYFLKDLPKLRNVVQSCGINDEPTQNAILNQISRSVATADNALENGEVEAQRKGRRLNPNPSPKKELAPPYIHAPDSDGLYSVVPRYSKFDPENGEPMGDLRGERRSGIWTDRDGYKKQPLTYRVEKNIITEQGNLNLPDGTYNFVIDPVGEIILGIQNTRYPHPSLLGGKTPRVKLAGEIHIRAGKLVLINNRSGHFSPSREALDQWGPVVVWRIEQAAREKTGHDVPVTQPEFRTEYDPRSKSLKTSPDAPDNANAAQ